MFVEKILAILVLAGGVLLILTPSRFYTLGVPHIQGAKPPVVLPGKTMRLKFVGESAVSGLCRAKVVEAKIFLPGSTTNVADATVLPVGVTKTTYRKWVIV